MVRDSRGVLPAWLVDEICRGAKISWCEVVPLRRRDLQRRWFGFGRVRRVSNRRGEMRGECASARDTER